MPKDSIKNRKGTSRAEKRRLAPQGGRPDKVIVAEQFEKLCAIQCTKEEICGVLLCSSKTLDRWCHLVYKQGFSQVYARFRSHGTVSVRRRIFNDATSENGDFRAAALWAKNYLGMNDKTPDEPPGEAGTSRVIIQYAPDEPEDEPPIG